MQCKLVFHSYTSIVKTISCTTLTGFHIQVFLYTYSLPYLYIVKTTSCMLYILVSIFINIFIHRYSSVPVHNLVSIFIHKKPFTQCQLVFHIYQHIYANIVTQTILYVIHTSFHIYQHIYTQIFKCPCTQSGFNIYT